MASTTPTKAVAATDWEEFDAQQAQHNAKINARRQVRQAARTQDGGYSPSTTKIGTERKEFINELEKKAEQVATLPKPTLTEEQLKAKWEREERERQDRDNNLRLRRHASQAGKEQAAGVASAVATPDLRPQRPNPKRRISEANLVALYFLILMFLLSAAALYASRNERFLKWFWGLHSSHGRRRMQH